MNTNFIITILCTSIVYTAAELKCEIKKGIDPAYVKISDAATKGIQYHDGRTKGNMQLFQCKCDENNVSYKVQVTTNIYFVQSTSRQ